MVTLTRTSGGRHAGHCTAVCQRVSGIARKAVREEPGDRAQGSSGCRLAVLGAVRRVRHSIKRRGGGFWPGGGQPDKEQQCASPSKRDWFSRASGVSQGEVTVLNPYSDLQSVPVRGDTHPSPEPALPSLAASSGGELEGRGWERPKP